MPESFDSGVISRDIYSRFTVRKIKNKCVVPYNFVVAKLLILRMGGIELWNLAEFTVLIMRHLLSTRKQEDRKRFRERRIDMKKFTPGSIFEIHPGF